MQERSLKTTSGKCICPDDDMRKRARNDLGSRIWNDQIRPYCALAARHRCFVAEVVKELKALGLNKITRQQVREWLVVNDKKRVEPKVGVGALLIEVVKKVAQVMP